MTGEEPGATQRRPWQRYLAEFIGTFMLVFAGCGAVISDAMTGGAVSHLGIALTFGCIVAVMIYALGPISAAHFNPAVTLGFATARHFPWRYVPAYLGAQAGGAILASLLHRLLYGADLAARARYGSTVPAVPTSAAIGFEVVLTFCLMLVIMAVATDRRVPGAALAALCYELLRDGGVHAQSAPADLDEALRREPGLSRR